MDGEFILEKIAFPLFSTFIGAFLAFRYQYQIEKRRDKRGVLQHLVVFRNVGADELEWIKMMNVVDLVFHDDERVRQLYAKYLEETEPERIGNGKHVDIYYEMLYEMAKASGYSQLMQSDLKTFYAPVGLRQHYPIGRKRLQYFPRYRHMKNLHFQKRRGIKR